MPDRCLLGPWDIAGHDYEHVVIACRGGGGLQATVGHRDGKRKAHCPQSRGCLPQGSRPCILERRGASCLLLAAEPAELSRFQDSNGL